MSDTDPAAPMRLRSDPPRVTENGGEKVDHGSGGMSPLRAA